MRISNQNYPHLQQTKEFLQREVFKMFSSQYLDQSTSYILNV